MRYFVSAGEASGDLHAAALIAQLRKLDPAAQFVFLGGDLMAEAAGCAPLIHYRQMAFMGFSEVLRHLPQIGENLKAAKQAIAASRPDCVILVDYPGFNLKLAKYASSLGIPVCWYIAPKVWAWKEHRIKALRRYVDLLLCILPFEVDYFRRHAIDAVYVGNPSLEEVDRKLAKRPSFKDFTARYGLADKPILALVPGSRFGEIKNNLPIMRDVAARYPELQPVIAEAPNIDAEVYARFAPELPRVAGATFDLMAEATAALVTSGTATLECALAGTPQVVCYRANGSRLSYNLMKMVLHIKYVALPNLIADSAIIPEMLVHLCTVEGVDRELSQILPGTPGRQRQLEGYALMRRRLGTSLAAETAAAEIVKLLDARQYGAARREQVGAGRGE